MASIDCFQNEVERARKGRRLTRETACELFQLEDCPNPASFASHLVFWHSGQTTFWLCFAICSRNSWKVLPHFSHTAVIGLLGMNVWTIFPWDRLHNFAGESATARRAPLSGAACGVRRGTVPATDCHCDVAVPAADRPSRPHARGCSGCGS